MAPGRKAATKPSTRRPPEEAPVTEYERQRMETMMRNSRVFRSLGIQEASDILKKSRVKATDATREDSGSLYQPGDGEDVEQGVFDKEAMQDLEPQVTKTTASGTRTKRVMAVALQEQDQPSRITRQRTRDLLSAREDTTDPQDGSTEDGLIAANANTQTNNQNELSTEGQLIRKSHVSRHVGRDLDNISRGLPNKIPVHIAEGKLRPEVPVQAAKLVSGAGIILRNHVPVFTHWKHYKEKDAIGVVKDFNDKVSSQLDADPVKDAFSDLLKKGQRQMRYKLKKQYFNGIPANKVRTTSPLTTMTDMQWKELVDMWSTPKHKGKCLKNKNSCDQVKFQQMTGSRSYVAQCYVAKQTKFKDAPPTAIDIFKDTLCSSKSGFSENAKVAIAEMEAYVAQPTEEGKDPKTPVEVVAHVLPKSTFLRNVGLQSTAMKRNTKSAAMNDRVHDLESKLEAEKMGSAGLQSQVANLQKQLKDQKEATRKNEEETEKLKQQGSEIQGFLRSLFGNKFASGDAQQ
ncbi:hypothetical protein C2845_PM15G10890 [Panicum miliaceum]|uniref:Transposase, Ptta/En/Spm, plant n=1 Tax=Panicum miliaceum TaxID=4540 RepID=A0A3L6Q9H2_PANMI|nr:hypothetical protein C2845_PM15G10890 [Panicum miliaceum]